MRSHEKTMRIRTSSLTVTAILALAAIFCAVPAGAVPMTQGTSIIVTFPAPSGNTNLAASAIVTLTSLTSSNAIIDVSISNNTLPAGAVKPDPPERVDESSFRSALVVTVRIMSASRWRTRPSPSVNAFGSGANVSMRPMDFSSRLMGTARIERIPKARQVS